MSWMTVRRMRLPGSASNWSTALALALAGRGMARAVLITLRNT
jgi:hypothetical protein